MLVVNLENSGPVFTKLRVSGSPIVSQTKPSRKAALRVPKSVGYATLGMITICGGLRYAYLPGKDSASLQPIEPTSTDSEIREKVDQALVLERQSRFRSAINVLHSVKSGNPIVVLNLLQLKQQLAAEILDRATDQFNQGNIEKAIRIASAIPIDSPAWHQLQSVQARWQADLTVLRLARTLQAKKPLLALDLLDQLSSPTRSGHTARRVRSQAIASLAPLPSVYSNSTIAASYPDSNSAAASQANAVAAEPSSRSSTRTIAKYSTPERITISPSTAHAALSHPTSQRGHKWSSPPIRRTQTAQKPVQLHPQAQCNDPTCDFAGFQ